VRRRRWCGRRPFRPPGHSRQTPGLSCDLILVALAMTDARRIAPDFAADLWQSARATSSTIDLGSMSDCLFFEHARRHGLPFRWSESWPTSARRAEIEGAILLTHTRVDGVETTVIALNVCLVELRMSHGSVSASLAAPDEDAAEPVIDLLKESLPRPSFKEDDPRAAFSFCWSSKHGLHVNTRTLATPPWREIRENYPAETVEGLEPLMSWSSAGRSGRTIIWHGVPGTGKTHALRALAHAWREWSDVQIVTDPDRLFTNDASYLMEVLVVRPPTSPEGRHRLLVLEDAGELLSRDARSFVGQGLSRFLNVCDGLLGQVVPITLLVTTNEPLRTLHPAVRRPGRCAATVEFAPLSVEKANAWLAQRTDARVVTPTPLCDLYALVEGSGPVERVGPRQPIGFGRVVA
jgi:hypothetical protein